MSNAQAERAINQLYESDTVRSELRDEEASLLLNWGESRLAELADKNLPDDLFDDLSSKLRTLLVAINYCVGKRKTMPSQHLTMMADIIANAEAAGYKLLPEGENGFLKHQAVLSNDEAIGELLGLLKPTDIPKPAPEVTIAAQAAEPEPPPAPAPEAELPLPETHVPVVSEHPPIVEPPIEGLTPTQPAALPDESPLMQLESQPTAEVQTAVDEAESAPQSQPPQPEDLPEFPQQPPQES